MRDDSRIPEALQLVGVDVVVCRIAATKEECGGAQGLPAVCGRRPLLQGGMTVSTLSTGGGLEDRHGRRHSANYLGPKTTPSVCHVQLSPTSISLSSPPSSPVFFLSPSTLCLSCPLSTPPSQQSEALTSGLISKAKSMRCAGLLTEACCLSYQRWQQFCMYTKNMTREETTAQRFT